MGSPHPGVAAEDPRQSKAALQCTKIELINARYAVKRSNRELALAMDVAREASQANGRSLARNCGRR
jgi:hypothetical protein